jgi:transposase-like protein
MLLKAAINGRRRLNEHPAIAITPDQQAKDETYLKVGGQWVYLYRSVDKRGKTVESYL